MVTKVSDDGDETTYEYDAIGRVIKTVRPDGSKTTYTYDERGNLVTLVNTGDDETLLSSFTYTYDEQGYIVKEVAESEDKKVTRRYSYNLSGELTLFTETEGLKYSEYAYSYDDSGNRIRLTKNGVEKPETITYEYNKANQLVSSTSTIDGKTEYEYDKNGSLISEQTDGEEEITYEYTVEQRLSAVREGGTLLMAASYDGDGNRVFQVSRKEAEQYVEKADPSESADAKDNHESAKDSTQSQLEDTAGLDDTVQAEQAATKTYYEKVYADPAETIFWYGFGQGIMHFIGNVNSALSAYLSDWFCHAWDFITGQYKLVLHSEGEYVNGYSEADIEAMRRAGLTEEDIAEILGIEVAEDSKSVVKYTESGNATQPSSDAKASASESVVIPENPDEKTRVDYELTYYVNDVNTENTQVLMEYGKRDELKNVYTYGNERISAETIADTFNPKTDDFEINYYLYDGRGSVTQVLNSSEIVESYTYDPFGNVTSGAPEFDSFYGYNAEDTNLVTGLQYLRFRYYDADNGRFSVADTYLGDVSDPLTLNRYAYTVNNPVMYIDSSGHFILTALVVGAVVGAVSSGVKSYKNQKANGGKVNGWTVAKDALVGGVVGGLVGAAAGVVGAAAAAAVTAVAGTGLAATIVAGAVGGVAGGIVSRGTNTVLSGAASNIIQKNNLYKSAVYTQQKSPRQILDEAVGNAFDVKAMVTDAMLGAAFAGGGYAIKNLVSKLRAVRQHSCGSAPKVGVQNPVEDLAPSVKKFIDNAAKSATNFVDDAAKSVTDFVDDAAKSVTDFVDDATKNVDDALNSLDDSKSIVDDAVEQLDEVVEGTTENHVKEPEIDGVRIINKKYAGKTYELSGDLAKKYPDGVKFSEKGFPDFEPYSIKKVTVDNLQGDAYYDFVKANKAAGFSSTPKGYTWHHVEDGKTLMLVPSDIHGAVRHTGGASLIRQGLRP